MKTKEITDLVTEYDSIFHEIDKLKERQREIISELLDAKLPYGNKKLVDIVYSHPCTISKVIKANYPEDSRYYYKALGIALDVRDLKKHRDEEAKRPKWEREEPKLVPDDTPPSIYREFGKYPRFELM